MIEVVKKQQQKNNAKISLSLFSIQIQFNSIREDLDAMVVMVSHIHLSSIVTGNTTGIVKLSLATARLSKSAGESKVRVQDLNTIITAVSHIQLLIDGIE